MSSLEAALAQVAHYLDDPDDYDPGEASRLLEEARKAPPAFQLPGSVDTLRRVARWADGVDERVWYPPPPGKAATVAQVLELYTLCRRYCVEDPLGLVYMGPEATAVWDDWVVRRGVPSQGSIQEFGQTNDLIVQGMVEAGRLEEE